MKFVLTVLVICSTATTTVMAGELEIGIEPVGFDEQASEILSRVVLDQPEVRARLGGGRQRVLEARFDNAEPEKERIEEAGDRYQVKVYDYDQRRLLTVEGSFSRSGDGAAPVARIEERSGAALELAPTADEIDEAAAIVRADPFFSKYDGLFVHYAAMPGVIPGDREAEPQAARDRIIAIGLLPRNSEHCGETGGACPVMAKGFRHEIVGVNLNRREVVRYPGGAPPSTRAEAMVCAVSSARQAVTARGVSGQALVRVSKDGQELWRMTAVRPSASSGRWGSGIDLRNVYYKGKRVLSQIHVPILNVRYENNYCGPYRDWQYSESYIQAQGALLASGILKASSEPKTIFESGSDSGTFRGMAVYVDGGKVVLRAELEAGWYRYKSEFTFGEDGSIQPRWGFAAVQSSCTCHLHHHHAYFRMDFDVGATAANTVEAYDGASWRPISTETRQRRDDRHRLWRVMAQDGVSGYLVTPGPNDGSSDAWGKGDAWILRYMQNQLDDSAVYTGVSANIDAYLTGQPTAGQDVVFWYAGHFDHHADGKADAGHVVGPTLTPIAW